MDDITLFSRRAMLSACSAAVLAGGCARAQIPAQGDAIAIPMDFFGLHINNGSPNGLWHQPQTPFPHIGQRAIRLWDSGTAWRNVNPAPGVFDFSRLDYRLREAHANGCKVMLTLGQPPNWASGGNSPSRNYNTLPPLTIDSWNDYVIAVTRHCGALVDYYEIWNEPDILSGYTGTLQQLLDMTKSAHGIIKREAPHALVMSPAFAGMDGGDFSRPVGLANWIAAGGLDFCDALAVHAYAGEGYAPEKLLERMVHLRAYLAQTPYAHLAIYDTESGSRGWRDAEGHPHNRPDYKQPDKGFNEPLPVAPLDLQSAWLVRQLLCTAASGFAQSYYYLFDNTVPGPGRTSVMAVNMVDYPTAPAHLRPPARAYQYLADLLAGGSVWGLQQTDGRYSLSFATRRGLRGTALWMGGWAQGAVDPAKFSHITNVFGADMPKSTATVCTQSPIFAFMR